MMMWLLNCGKRTIKLLYASAIVIGESEGLSVHPLVKGSHDGWRIIGVLQTKGMTQFMHRNQENIITWNGVKTKTQFNMTYFSNNESYLV